MGSLRYLSDKVRLYIHVLWRFSWTKRLFMRNYVSYYRLLQLWLLLFLETRIFFFLTYFLDVSLGILIQRHMLYSLTITNILSSWELHGLVDKIRLLLIWAEEYWGYFGITTVEVRIRSFYWRLLLVLLYATSHTK